LPRSSVRLKNLWRGNLTLYCLILFIILAFSVALLPQTSTKANSSPDPGMTLSKTVEVSSLKPGERANFTITYSNVMSETAYNVTVFEWMPSGLTFVSSKPFYDGVSTPETGFFRWSRGNVPPGGSGAVNVKAMVENVPVGTVITNTAHLSYELENGTRVELTSSVDISVLQAAGVDVYPDQIHSVPPSSWYQTEFNLTVTNTGNGLDTFNISLSSVAFNPTGSRHDWKIELYNSTGYPTNPVATVYDESLDDPTSWTDHGVLTSVTLASGESTWFMIKVTEAPGTYGNAEAFLDVHLIATSQFDPSVSDLVDKITLVKFKVGITFGPDYTKYANPGETVVFRHIIVNSGETEVIDLSYTSSRGWSYSFWFDDGTPLEDTNGNGYVDVGLLPKEEYVYILVKVTVPYGTAAGVNDTAVITARGATSGNFDTATDITIVKSAPILSVEKRLVSGNPSYVGDAVTYRMNITNLGNTRLTKIPLDDAYETPSLNFSSAIPTEDEHDETAGTIHWEDLTALEPRQSILVTVNFLATGADDVVRESANVIDAEDEFGNLISATYVNTELRIIGLYTLTVTASPTEALGGSFSVSWTERGVLKDGTFTTPRDFTCDQDTTAEVSDPESPITKDGVRYVFTHYSPSATVTMDSDKTVTLNYRTEYSLTFQQTGSQESVCITVNGTLLTEALPKSFWVYKGSNTTFSYPSPITDAAGTTRYVLTGVTGNTTNTSVIVNAPTIVTGAYKTQYHLTVSNGGHGTASGEGWYDSGVLATFSIDPTTVYEGVGTRYVFTQWSGDSTSTNPSDTVLMDGPKTVTANWKTQYLVSFTQTGSVVAPNVTYAADTDPTETVPFNIWVRAGSTLTFSYDAMVNDGQPTRYVWVSVNQTSPFTVDSPVTITAAYKTQHYLTVGHSPVDSILDGHQTGQDYYDAESTATVTADLHVDIVSGASRYTFDHWSGDASGSGTTTTVVMSGPKTATATYKTQYYITVTSEGGHDSPTPSAWVDAGSDFTASVTSPTEIVPNDEQWVCTGFSIDGGAYQAGTTYTFVNVQAAHTIDFAWKQQFWVVFQQTGVPGGVTAHVTVNSVQHALPYSDWFDRDSSINFAYESPVPGVAGTRYVLTSTSEVSPLTVEAPTTVTGNYKTQYHVTFAHTGLDSTATGTVVTVGGSSKSYGDLPYGDWFDSGTTYTYSTIVSSSVQDKRFRLNSVTGPASPITNSGTVTGVYVPQYKVTFTQSGLDNTATGTVVTVAGVSKTYEELPFKTDWLDHGTSLAFEYSSIVASSGSGKQFELFSVSHTSPLSVTAPTTVAGTYKTQGYITFDQSGVGSDFTGTVVSIDTVEYAGDALPVSFWWDKDSTHDFAFASPLNVDGKRYVWTSTSGLSSLQSGSLTVTTSGIVAASYKTQYQVTFTQSGVGIDFTETVMSIDDNQYSVANLPAQFWWDKNSLHSFAFQSPLVVTQEVKRYVWNTTSGLSTLQSDTSFQVTQSGSITGNYKIQYYIAVTSAHDSPTPSAWVYAGSDFTASVTSPADDDGMGTRYRCTGYRIEEGELEEGTSYTFTNVQAAHKIVFEWIAQRYLTVKISPSDVPTTISGEAWYDENTLVPLTAPLLVPVSEGVRYGFDQWTVDTTASPSNSMTVEMDAPKTATAQYVKQFKLTIDNGGHGTTTPASGNWYDAGKLITITMASDTTSNSTGTRYLFASWSGSGSGSYSGSANPCQVQMDGPITEVASWKTQYYLTVITDPADLDDPTGEGWYDEGTKAAISVDTPTGGDLVETRYRFHNWTGVGIADSAAASTTILMDAPKVAKAVFIQQFYLTMSTNLGDVTPDSGWYDVGSIVSIEATEPAVVQGKGYVWHGWTGTGERSYSGLDNPAAVTMNSAISETAHWKIDPILTITISNETIASGDRIIVSGTTLPVQSRVEVSVIYVLPNGTQIEHIVQTNDEGDFEDVLLLDQGYLYSLFRDAGDWEITANREGDFNHETAEASTTLEVGAPSVVQLHPALIAGLILAGALIAYAVIVKKVKNNKNAWWGATAILCGAGLIFGVASLALNWVFVSGAVTIENMTYQVGVLLYPFTNGLVSITEGIRYLGAAMPSMVDPTWQNILGSTGPVLTLWLIPVGCLLLLLVGLYKPKNARQRNLKVAFLVFSGVLIVISVVHALIFVQGQVGTLEGAGTGYGAGVYMAIISGTLTILSGLFASERTVVNLGKQMRARIFPKRS